MEDDYTSPAVSSPTRSRWTLTESGLHLLLDRLGPSRERAAEEYEALRAQLIQFFEWKNLPHPDDLADRAIDRVIRRLQDGEAILSINGYVYGVARRLVQEAYRGLKRETDAQEHLFREAARTHHERSDEDEARACLEKCLQTVPAQDRQLVLAYYEEVGRTKIDDRKALAASSGLQPGALRTRVHRIRARLEECTRRCMALRRQKAKS